MNASTTRGKHQVNLRPHRKESPDLNITPLIDVVFLLLIFFMVSTTFDRESRIKVELPEAATQDEQIKEEKQLDIVVDAKGHYFVNQKEV
ncbi:MAG: biopolymer transporter ExbD, partial [Candidatus Sedimenticola sp. 20ELBAFRAG]